MTAHTTFTPPDTVKYEQLAKASYNRVATKRDFIAIGDIEVKIMAYFKIPASASKAAKTRMLEDRLRPTKKPDVDNIIKIVLDALNNTAWHDDAQVTDVICEKHYGIIPRVEVTIRAKEAPAATASTIPII